MIKKFIRPFFSQSFINNFYHLPIAILANIIFGFPTRKLKVIGVTGTDGKTTTTNMIYKILKNSGRQVSMISTINAVVGAKSYDTGFHVTSPSPFLVQKFAKEAVDSHDEYLVLEVTSHALDQHRFWGIKFEIGVITNVTHEHLDYHKTFENYLNTKLGLLKNVKYAILNWNLKSLVTRLEEIGKKIFFGMNKGDFNQKEVKLNLKLQGNHNIENALAAFAVAFVLGIDKKIARRSLEDFGNLTGRMEEIKNDRGIKIVIDFAHTPNALENMLRVLRTQTPKKIIAVFGCAGKRDSQKRPLMGAISARLSDITVVTAEDPRGELEKINGQILRGALKAGAKLGENLFVISDRKKAIEFAIQHAHREDTVGIFGKGHETSLNLDGKNELPWSDLQAVKAALIHGF